MKLLKKINKKILSISLATAMALGFVSAPMPMLLDGNHVAEATVSQVTVLPDPDKVGGLGTGANVPLGLDTVLTTISENQVINNEGIVLLGFNKNVTTKKKKNPLPFDVITVNTNKVYVTPSNDTSKKLIYGTVVSQKLLDEKNQIEGTTYNVENYRNYIYLDTTGLAAGSYSVIVEYGIMAANGQTIDGVGNYKVINFTVSN